LNQREEGDIVVQSRSELDHCVTAT
jgi:hypothetical protein